MAADDFREKLVQLIREKGPVVPSDVYRELNTNILIASVMLSDVAGLGKVRISRLKVGGSPLYYLPEQAEQLQRFSGRLGAAERKAYEILKEGKLLADRTLDPQTRVALRQLKDFAVPVEKSRNGGSELLWKWYLLPDEEAEQRVHGSEKAVRKEGNRREEQGLKAEAAPFTEAIQSERPAAIPSAASEAEPEASAVRAESAEVTQERGAGENLGEEAGEHPEVAVGVSEQKKPRKAARKKPAPKERADVLQFLSAHAIEVLETLASKKGDAEFMVSVPNPLGGTRYYCRFRDKKLCNDADVSAAIVQGQLRKLPVLFLSTGGLSKKAEEVLSSQQNILYRKVG